MKRARLTFAVLAAGLCAASVPAAAQSVGRTPCEICHSDREVLTRRASPGRNADSLVVTRAHLAGTAHAAVTCTGCHRFPPGLGHPGPRPPTVACGTCHARADSLWHRGSHARAGGASCASCHGTHDIRPARELARGGGARGLSARCVTCHADRALPADDVHRDTVSCAACHGSHEMGPVRTAATHGLPSAVLARCEGCHTSVAALAGTSIHTDRAHEQAAGLRSDSVATCVACHGGHGVLRARQLDGGRAITERCAACHKHPGESYLDTYHGRAIRLGSRQAANCADCHGSHQVFGAADPRSSIAPEHLVATCARCHAGTQGSKLLSYRAHPRLTDFHDSKLIFGTWLFMMGLIGSVFAFFLPHTVLWLVRIVKIRHAERARRKTLGLPSPRESIDSAQRGHGPFVWRFRLLHRLVHGTVVVSFFALVISGLPIRFSCAAWAGGLMHLLGGTPAARLIHRVAAVIMVLAFVVHITSVTRFVVRNRKNWRTVFWGPDSMVPQPKDLLDMIQMFKWFLGKGKEPRFGRYRYVEKVDYLGAFWGIILLAVTGLIRWFPAFFAQFLPGWAFNVAAIAHGEEAVLAISFLFLFHYFNVHLKPDKFPMDGVMFTGRLRVSVLEEEHPLTAEALGDIASRPVSRRAIPDEPAPEPPPSMTVVAATLGLLAMAVGLLLIGMMLWVQVC